MMHFNHQEKMFLLSACAFLFLGASMQLAMKKYPFLSDIVHVIDSEHAYPKLDINTADEKALERIPYIGAYTARQIVVYRETHGPFRTVDELQNVKGIRLKNYERFRPYLKVRGQGVLPRSPHPDDPEDTPGDEGSLQTRKFFMRKR